MITPLGTSVASDSYPGRGLLPKYRRGPVLLSFYVRYILCHIVEAELLILLIAR